MKSRGIGSLNGMVLVSFPKLNLPEDIPMQQLKMRLKEKHGSNGFTLFLLSGQ